MCVHKTTSIGLLLDKIQRVVPNVFSNIQLEIVTAELTLAYLEE